MLLTLHNSHWHNVRRGRRCQLNWLDHFPSEAWIYSSDWWHGIQFNILSLNSLLSVLCSLVLQIVYANIFLSTNWHDGHSITIMCSILCNKFCCQLWRIYCAISWLLFTKSFPSWKLQPWTYQWKNIFVYFLNIFDHILCRIRLYVTRNGFQSDWPQIKRFSEMNWLNQN